MPGRLRRLALPSPSLSAEGGQARVQASAQFLLTRTPWSSAMLLRASFAVLILHSSLSSLISCPVSQAPSHMNPLRRQPMPFLPCSITGLAWVTYLGASSGTQRVLLVTRRLEPSFEMPIRIASLVSLPSGHPVCRDKQRQAGC